MKAGTWLLGASLAVVLALAGCGAAGSGGSFAASDPSVVTRAAVGPDASLAWSREMPEEGQVVERVTPLGDWFFVFFSAEALDQDDPRTAVVYDAGGEVRWSHTGRGLSDALVARSGELVYLQEGGFRAVSVRDGDEVWASEASLSYVAERGDVLVLSRGDETDVHGFTVLLDSTTGEQIAEVSGDPVAVGDDSVTVVDEDVVHQVDLRGRQRWSSDEPAGEPSGGELVTGAAGDGFVLVEDTVDEQDNWQRAYDVTTGAQLWHVRGLWILGEGPGGTVLALDHNDDRSDELVLFDQRGEAGRVDVGALEATVSTAGFTPVKGVGEVFVDQGRLVDSALELVELGDRIQDLTVDGAYLLGTSDDTVTLASWTGAEQFAVRLDEPASELWALDGAVLVQTDDGEIQLYR